MTLPLWAATSAASFLLLTCVVLAINLARTRASLKQAVTAGHAAARAQERTAELAVAAERIRIVREMHDVLAHSLAIMVAQADGGSYVTADAAASRRAFTTIAETGRAALQDTRRILGVLRHGEDSPQGLAPVPDDASTATLVARARDAGMTVSLVRVGQPRHLPAGSRMALYRICQEALTNVFKHAGEQARTIVTEDWGVEAVTLSVTNEAGLRPASVEDPLGGLGLGLIGMRERAEVVGGRLRAEPTEEGFLVEATLPTTGPGEGEEEAR